ncbi:SMC-Scp complex subunit ScpB [uncultured Psychrosphaera sp.]|jgi:segregation and condensation protein B|uniref:SMC-Scp complex subunit ScpB n=1 Tax=uncultured Psychrosphaera sp. TaxID=1403522 RepID=UPI0026313A49|nr:SMC-Scp complex subunit ScpB [uncultured Psychrosphaera sp.]
MILDEKHEVTELKLKQIIEAAIFTSETPLTLDKLKQTVLINVKVSNSLLNSILSDIKSDYSSRGVNLVKLASGYRFQAATNLGQWLTNLLYEKPAKYSRALLETLALIAYKQPITRGEIENVRGVSVSSNIVRTLVERNWIKVVGHKEVPGRPSLYGTTNEFLDYFSLTSLSQLPELIEPESLDIIAQRIENEFMGQAEEPANQETDSDETQANPDELSVDTE